MSRKEKLLEQIKSNLKCLTKCAFYNGTKPKINLTPSKKVNKYYILIKMQGLIEPLFLKILDHWQEGNIVRSGNKWKIKMSSTKTSILFKNKVKKLQEKNVSAEKIMKMEHRLCGRSKSSRFSCYKSIIIVLLS